MFYYHSYLKIFDELTISDEGLIYVERKYFY